MRLSDRLPRLQRPRLSLPPASAMRRTMVRRPAPLPPLTSADTAPRFVIDNGSSWRALRRAVLYVGLTLVSIPFQYLLLCFGVRAAYIFPPIYHRWCCKILGFDLRLVGQRSTVHPTLFVANHTSYLDIMILGAAIPASFVSKAEVAKWPLFGTLAKLQRSVFIDRQRRSTAQQRDGLGQRLAEGANLILFPEGTSGDGNQVLPFRSALMSVAERHLADGRPLTVQPVSVAYTRLDGVPIGRALRPLFAWYGDMAMGSHLWRLIGLGDVEVVVQFHAPVTIDGFASRKELTHYCHARIADGLSRALSGRLDDAA